MSRIDDLIAEHCPDGVRHISVGDLGVLFGGLTGKTKKDFTEGNARYLTYTNVFHNLAVDLNAQDFVKVATGESQREVQVGDVIFTGSSETAEEVGMSSVVVSEPESLTYLNSFCFALRAHSSADLNPEFAKHLFRSTRMRRQIQTTASGVTRFNISKEKFRKLLVPVPPMSVQREIAAILDKFVALEAELEAELEARQRQYLHFRKALLAEHASVYPLMPLGTFLDLRAGRSIQARDITKVSNTDHPYPCFGGGGQRGFTKDFSHDGTYVLIGRQGALCGNVKRATGKFYATEHAVVAQPISEPVDMSWVFHMLTEKDLNQYASKSAQPGLAVGAVNKVEVTVPPPAEQRRIGAILDSLLALTEDISMGLPAEIAMRRQQYEYYRDKLLTFKEITP